MIGGGLVGTAIAYGLARIGQRVALFDEGDIALRLQLIAAERNTTPAETGYLPAALPDQADHAGRACIAAADRRVGRRGRSHQAMSLTRNGLAMLLAGCLLHACAAHAVLSINEPWLRAERDGRSAALFVRLTSSDEAAVVAVDSFAARRTSMRDAARAVNAIALPAGTLVELRPGGFHVRLDGLVRRLKLGEHVPVTLVITTAGGLKQTIYVNAEVRHHSPSEDEISPHQSHTHRR